MCLRGLRWLGLVRSREEKDDRCKASNDGGSDDDQATFGRRGFAVVVRPRSHFRGGRSRGRGLRLRDGGGGIEKRFDIAQGKPGARIVTQATARDLGKGPGQESGNSGIAVTRSIPKRRALGERFNQGDTERPDVCNWMDGAGGGFGGVVDGGMRRLISGAGRVAEVVDRQLELVFDDHDIRRFQAAVKDALAMKIGEHFDDRKEHFPGFVGAERAFGNDLREGFLGIFGDDVKQLDSVDAALAEAKDGHQVGVRKSGHPCATIQLRMRVFVSGRDEPDGGSARLGTLQFSAEDACLLGTAYPFEEEESTVNYLTDPVFFDNGGVHQQELF